MLLFGSARCHIDARGRDFTEVVHPSLPTDAKKFAFSPTRCTMLCDFYLVAWVWEHRGQTSGCEGRFDLEPRSIGTLVASSTSI
jgi:hypothetical protein